MTGQEEFAERPRAAAEPSRQHWGIPEGRGTSEERVNWVMRNIARGPGAQGAGS